MTPPRIAMASCLAVVLLAASTSGSAQTAPAPASLVPAQSEIAFQVRQSGVPVDGRFRRFEAQVSLDPKAPSSGTVTIAVDTASATVGFPDSDAELPRAPWFNAAKYPRAVFRSTSIKALGGGRLQVSGRLDLKGSTQELSIPVTIAPSGALSAVTGEFVVKRLDFRIGENEWADLSLVANDVRVRFKLVFSGLGVP